MSKERNFAELALDFIAPYEKAASNLETAAMFGIFKCFTFELCKPPTKYV